MSTSHRDVHVDATAAPSATNATWPREICPAHPVSTTSERTMTAKMTTAVALIT